MPDPIHTPSCFRGHMGQYMIEPGFMSQAVAAIRAGIWKAGDVVAVAPRAAGTVVFDPETENSDWPKVAYVITEGGIAVMDLTGAMAKAAGKYAAVGTVAVRRYLRMAAADTRVAGVMIGIDSPGGTCAGTQQLGDEIRATDALKPVHIHAEDCIASAGFWVGCQGRRLTASRATLVGSLGTYVVLEDSSKKAEMEGISVIVVSTGPQKGAYVDGAPITPEQIAEAQAVVDGLNGLFKQAVASGRKMEDDKVAKLFDGRVHMADKAKELGLIDAVESFDAALANLSRAITASQHPAQDNARRLRLAKARP